MRSRIEGAATTAALSGGAAITVLADMHSTVLQEGTQQFGEMHRALRCPKG
jgi:23S rRNA G2069 N7-methylase RlmK/C1962 C5-methylase RlmI